MPDTWFDKVMMALTELLIPFWMPLVAGSLIAILAKRIVPLAPIPDGPKNLVLRVAGWVRTAAVYLVLFLFVVLFWSLSHASREAKYYQSQYQTH